MMGKRNLYALPVYD